MVDKVFRQICAEEFLNNMKGKNKEDENLIQAAIDNEIDQWDSLATEIEEKFPYFSEQVDPLDFIYFCLANFPKPYDGISDVKGFIEDVAAEMALGIANYIRDMDCVLKEWCPESK